MSGKEMVIFKNILLEKQYRDVKVEVVFSVEWFILIKTYMYGSKRSEIKLKRHSEKW